MIDPRRSRYFRYKVTDCHLTSTVFFKFLSLFVCDKLFIHTNLKINYGVIAAFFVHWKSYKAPCEEFDAVAGKLMLKTLKLTVHDYITV